MQVYDLLPCDTPAGVLCTTICAVLCAIDLYDFRTCCGFEVDLKRSVCRGACRVGQHMLLYGFHVSESDIIVRWRIHNTSARQFGGVASANR